MNGHILFTDSDFTEEEYERRNKLAVLVIDGGLSICKKCKRMESELSELCDTTPAVMSPSALTQDSVETTRSRFEDEVFNAHFFSTIVNTGLGSCLTFLPDPVKTLPQDELCERDGDDYKRPEVSAMWWGWKKALEFKGGI